MGSPIHIAAVSLQAYALFDPTWPRPFGGAELQVRTLLQALAGLGAECYIVTLGPPPARTLEWEGVKVVVVPRRGPLLRPLTALDINQALYRIGPQIVLQRGYGYETGIAAWFCSRQGVAFVHMLASERDVGPATGWEAWAPMRLVHRYGLRRAARIYTQHGGQLRALREQLGLASIVMRSLHWIPPLPERPGKEMLWVGRCVAIKQPLVFLDLVEQLPDVPARMVCPRAGDAALFEQVRQRAEGLANCTFHDGLPFDQTEALFAQARVLVQTSLNEGFPNTIVQAAKYGVPIASLNVNPDTIITVHDLGGFADGNFDKLLAITARLLRDDRFHAARRENAYSYAREYHDVNRIAPLFMADFRRLTGAG